MRIIAGPCQHESVDQSIEIASHCKSICDDMGIDYVFKASYDKANRTHISGARGKGLIETLMDFVKVKERIPDLKIMSDFHTTNDMDYVIRDHYDFYDIKQTVDIIQIPALLSRQTDLLEMAAKSGKIVNVKKGQFMAPWDIHGVMSKLQGAKEVWITERGTTFGYNRLIVDFVGLNYLLLNFDNIILDCTHPCQTPSSEGTASGGNREYVPGLARAGSALGVQNFFMEVHPDPDNALSDGPNSLYLKDFFNVVKDIKRLNYEIK